MSTKPESSSLYPGFLPFILKANFHFHLSPSRHQCSDDGCFLSLHKPSISSTSAYHHPLPSITCDPKFHTTDTPPRLSRLTPMPTPKVMPRPLQPLIRTLAPLAAFCPPILMAYRSINAHRAGTITAFYPLIIHRPVYCGGSIGVQLTPSAQRNSSEHSAHSLSRHTAPSTQAIVATPPSLSSPLQRPFHWKPHCHCNIWRPY